MTPTPFHPQYFVFKALYKQTAKHHLPTNTHTHTHTHTPNNTKRLPQPISVQIIFLHAAARPVPSLVYDHKETTAAVAAGRAQATSSGNLTTTPLLQGRCVACRLQRMIWRRPLHWPTARYAHSYASVCTCDRPTNPKPPCCARLRL